jgi:hypothetical protein
MCLVSLFHYFTIRNLYIRFNFMRISINKGSKWFNVIQPQIYYLLESILCKLKLNLRIDFLMLPCLSHQIC